jgi:hypothetical protein
VGGGAGEGGGEGAGGSAASSAPGGATGVDAVLEQVRLRARTRPGGVVVTCRRYCYSSFSCSSSPPSSLFSTASMRFPPSSSVKALPPTSLPFRERLAPQLLIQLQPTARSDLLFTSALTHWSVPLPHAGEGCAALERELRSQQRLPFHGSTQSGAPDECVETHAASGFPGADGAVPGCHARRRRRRERAAGTGLHSFPLKLLCPPHNPTLPMDVTRRCSS